jgi:O-antigen ligase
VRSGAAARDFRVKVYFGYELLIYSLMALALSIVVVFLQPFYLLALPIFVGFLALGILCVRSPRSWLYLCAATTLAVPPLYPAFLGSDIPVYSSSLILLIGWWVLLVRFEEFEFNWDPIASAAFYFLLALALSLPFGFWLSGPAQGLQSLFRFLLILQPFFLYFWIRGSKVIEKEALFSSLIKFLLCVATVAAIYGIIDFYLPVPIPHPFADQYIYLKGENIRRAQGIFYEASSFGNMCAFFMSLSLVVLYSLGRKLSLVYQSLLCVMIGIFTTALFLSYSRGSWANVLVTMAIFLLMQRKFQLRSVAYVVLLIGGFILLVFQFSPEIASNFFSWRLGALSELWSDPNFATSGRWETWIKLTEFFADHPSLLLFGIGYKTLPYTNLIGKNLIADNGFISLSFETGVLGLAAFIWLNFTLLKSLYRTSRHQILTFRLYGGFLFAFWCGEMVQMMTGDIFTYWRNVIIFFTLIAALQELSQSLRPEQDESASSTSSVR